MSEVLAVVAVVLLLTALAIPGYKAMNTGADQSTAVRNAETLNSAVQQYDQAGGLMTAKVVVPSDVSSIKSPSSLPEMMALNLLRDANQTAAGELVSSWQEPVFSDKGYRVVWANSLNAAEAERTTGTIGGLRNIAAERAIAKGIGGRFVVLAPDAQLGRLGITGFQEAPFEAEPAAPAPAATPLPQHVVSLALSSPSAGTVTGNGDYTHGTVANISITLAPGWVIKSWDPNTTALLGSSVASQGSFAVVEPVTGTMTVEETLKPVYIFGNNLFPVSTANSGSLLVDYSVSLADEYGGTTGVRTTGLLGTAGGVNVGSNFGGVFGRLSIDAWQASQRYGEMFKKIVVIDSFGGLVGIYDSEPFLASNVGFNTGVLLGAGSRAGNLNTYKDKIAVLPDGTRVTVLENAMASPLIVDWDRSGNPGLLSGGDWKTPRDVSIDMACYRQVNLDGTGSSSWEWIDSKDALLVDLTQAMETSDDVSKFVFGNHTWGKSWGDGFAALSQLDKDGNKVVAGNELDSVGLTTAGIKVDQT